MGEPDLTLPRILDNLIAQKRVPAMAVVMIQNGGGDAQGHQRGLEYDTMSGLFAEFIQTEVLPKVESNFGIKLTTDPEGRAAMGCSSAPRRRSAWHWYHPEWYHRIISYPGTYVNQQWPFNPATPGGAWEYHINLIPNNPAKPFRVWMHVGDRDLYSPTSCATACMTGWKPTTVSRRRSSPRAITINTCTRSTPRTRDRRVREQTLPEALEYVWKGYK